MRSICKYCHQEIYNKYPDLSTLWGDCPKMFRIHHVPISGVKLTAQTVVQVEKQYLMPLHHALPFLASMAGIIMTCLEIAWHT